MNRRSIYILLTVLIFSSCGTPKELEQSVIKKAYHNTTARHNRYYNANMEYTASRKELEAQYIDNFNKLLEVYPSEAIEGGGQGVTSLDSALQRCAELIVMHPGSRWADNGYLLMGKIYHLQQDYKAAMETFSFIEKEFDPENLSERYDELNRINSKKKKKKKKKRKKTTRKKKKKKKKTSDDEVKVPKNYILKHKPIWQEARMWKAKTLVSLGRTAEADGMLTRLSEEEGVPKNLRKEIAVTQAFSKLKQGQYSEGIAALENALELHKKKKEKTRLYFILSQLYQENNEYAIANEYLDKVMKSSPSSEMEFQVKIQKITNEFLSQDTEDLSALKKELLRMSKEYKYVEYRDQVFYKLAEIEYGEGDIQKAKEYLNTSLEENSPNTVQTAETEYFLASIYYAESDYQNAKYFYDAAAQNFLASDERMEEVQSRSLALTNIVEVLESIQLKDSLLSIYAMDDASKRAVAKSLIESQGTANSTDFDYYAASLKASSSFWAYNEKGAKKASREFRDIWGDIGLVDNWRRSDQVDEIADLDIRQNEGSEIPQSQIDQLFKDVPKNDKAAQKMNDEVRLDMMLLAKMYDRDLRNTPKAIEVYEDILKRFGDDIDKSRMYYTLYLLSIESGDEVREMRYLKKLQEEFPGSDYEEYATNPQLVEEDEKNLEEASTLYVAAKDDYLKGDIPATMLRITKFEETYGMDVPELSSKVAYLKALAIGEQYGKEQYVAALKKVALNYPTSPEGAEAIKMLRYLEEGSTVEHVDKEPEVVVVEPVPLEKESVEPVEESPVTVDMETGKYSFDPISNQFILFVPRGTSASIFDMRKEVISYMESAFADEGVQVSSLTLKGGTSVLLLRQFSGHSKAKPFYDTLNQAPHTTSMIKDSKGLYDLYIISINDFSILLQDGDLTEYITFHGKVFGG